MLKRPRRLRKNGLIRSLVRETKISRQALVYPIFVKDGEGLIEPIKYMPKQNIYSVDKLGYELEKVMKSGVRKIMLVGIPDKRNEYGSEAYEENGVLQRAVKFAKKEFPDLFKITEINMSNYTSHGHSGIMKSGNVDNDETLKYISKIALSHAHAGADMLAPSDMMDGRIKVIRNTLDENKYTEMPIMSYAAKYDSQFDYIFSSPTFGTKRSYQLDYHNIREAVREAKLDESEGADIIAVQPAMSYLDVISSIKHSSEIPVAAGSSSGEYAMIKLAAEAGIVNEKELICETAVSAFRAGADILISYYAKEISQYIENGDIG